MLSYLGSAAELSHGQACRKADPFCPISQSLNYIASALASRPASAKSMLSFSSTQTSSIPEETSPEELSDGESPANDTCATSVTSESTRKGSSTSNGRTKSKTLFRLAHPPPISIHKQHLHIRPKVLLQLQKTSGTSRPIPVLEVLPSVVYASRLARRFPRTFKGKAGLGADDLVIMSSEDYKTESSDVDEYEQVREEKHGVQRAIVAAICRPGKGEAESNANLEICMTDGLGWTVSRFGNGVYEFVSVDDHGLRSVARWVPKQSKSGPRTPTIGRDLSTSEEKKFCFSLLNPNSRRHAIIASLDRHSIEVSDWYVDPETVRKDTDSLTPTLLSSSEESPTRDPIEVSHDLRSLIIVTGICVAFEEGFSSRSGHDNTAPSSPNPSIKQHHRSFSLGNSQTNSTQPSKQAGNPVGNLQRARASLQQTRSSSAVPQPPRPGELKALPRRTSSSGGAFMERLKGRNSASNQKHQLDDIIDGGIESTSTKRDVDYPLSAPTQRRTVEYQETAGKSPSDKKPSHMSSLPKEASSQVPTGKRRRRRFSKLFGCSRKTSETA